MSWSSVLPCHQLCFQTCSGVTTVIDRVRGTHTHHIGRKKRTDRLLMRFCHHDNAKSAKGEQEGRGGVDQTIEKRLNSHHFKKEDKCVTNSLIFKELIYIICDSWKWLFARFMFDQNPKNRGIRLFSCPFFLSIMILINISANLTFFCHEILTMNLSSSMLWMFETFLSDLPEIWNQNVTKKSRALGPECFIFIEQLD